MAIPTAPMSVVSQATARDSSKDDTVNAWADGVSLPAAAVKPKFDAFKPKVVEASKPKVEAPKSKVEAPKSEVEATRPNGMKKKPNFEVPQYFTKVSVGSPASRRMFHVYTDFLAYHSSYFEKTLKAGVYGAERGVILLPDIAPEVFGSFVSYIYTGDIVETIEADRTKEGNANGELDKPSFQHLIKVWTAAQYLETPGLQELMMAKIRSKTQRLEEAPGHLIDNIYKNTSINSPLRKLMVDMTCSCGGIQNREIAENLPKEFLIDLAMTFTRVFSNSIPQGPPIADPNN